jgi:hypothetical protein
MNGKPRPLLWLIVLVVVVAGLALWLGPLLTARGQGVRSAMRDRWVYDWIMNPSAHQDWVVEAGLHCDNAPFQMPTRGFIGYLWDDSFRPGHRHQGLDIFGGEAPGITPVYAAADGYLTRLPEWKSTVIIRVPDDPLQPGRTIWMYYTHLADALGRPLIDPAFPPGTQDVFVQAGTLLGTQGNFSGTPGSPVGVHLHFSIVLDDGAGSFLNELDIENTLDPSPYLGLNVNAHTNNGEIPMCLPVEDPS